MRVEKMCTPAMGAAHLILAYEDICTSEGKNRITFFVPLTEVDRYQSIS